MRTIFGAVLLAIVGVFLLAGSASAAGEAVSGKLENRIDGSRTPVAGVEITVEGNGVNTTVKSGADGKWTVPLPSEGVYKVTLNVDTLPEGVALTEEGKNVVEAKVQPPIMNLNVNFPLGVSNSKTESKWQTAMQLFVEGLRFGLLIALGALGLSLIYGTTGLTNFAHGELISFGALMTFTFNVILHVPLVIAGLIGVILTALFGAAQNGGLWKPLRKRGSGLIAMMIVSIGLAIFLRNVFLYFFGGDKKAYAEYVGQAGLQLGPVTLTPSDLVTAVIAIVALGVTVIAIQKTRLGKATRAVADNPALASSAGIDVERVIMVVWIVGAALAGLCGVLIAFAQQVSFQMGFQLLLLIFAAVTLGGLGTVWGAIVGSLVVGLFLQLSTLFIPPELKNVGALLVLIVILLIRPYGLLGRSERVG